MNRGSWNRAQVIDRSRLPTASMRPRFMNRGSAPDDQASTHGSYPVRFNEAPIHESGKLAGRLNREYRRRSARFNEAPIHESGKS